MHPRVASPLIAAAFSIAAAFLPWGSTASGSDHTDEPVALAITAVDVEGHYFDLTVTPGETRYLTILLSNHATEPVRATTYAADAYSLVNGGFGARLDGEPTTGTTQWLSYPRETLELGAREGEPRTFAVTVPASTPPGDYITSVVIENAEPVTGSGGVTVNQVVRQAVAVAMTVVGDRHPELSIGEISDRSLPTVSIIGFSLRNPGDTHLRPSGRLTLTDEARSLVDERDVSLDSVYAGTDTRVEVVLGQLLPAGRYEATLTLEDPETGASDSASAIFEVLATPDAPPPAASPAAAAVDVGSGPPLPVEVAGNSSLVEGPWALALLLTVAGLGIASSLMFARRARLATRPPVR